MIKKIKKMVTKEHQLEEILKLNKIEQVKNIIKIHFLLIEESLIFIKKEFL